jgi:putative ABC transport system ATP-binding protein
MRSVSFGYPSCPTVLDGVDFAAGEGDLVVVSGPSGGGKSTFLRLLCHLETPTGGEVRFRGTPLAEIPAPELRRRAAYLQQVPVVLPLSIEENLLLPFTLRSNRLPRPSRADLRHMLAVVGLDGVSLEKSAEELSVGQKQRVCLVRTLLLQPDVLLLDEPLSALDACAAEAVLALLVDVNRSARTTVVMVSHTRGKDLPGTRYAHLEGGSLSEDAR